MLLLNPSVKFENGSAASIYLKYLRAWVRYVTLRGIFFQSEAITRYTAFTLQVSQIAISVKVFCSLLSHSFE